MKKNVQSKKPPMSPEAKVWIDDEIEAQEQRYKSIVEEIDALEETRAEWIEEFLNLIQTRGFFVTGNTKVKIPKDDIPKKPDRPDAMRVIW